MLTLLRILSLSLGAASVYANRFTMTGDGISYLDMGDAYLRGDWGNAVNGVWSPLYGVVVSLAQHVVHPAPTDQYIVVHLVDFLIYILVLWRFDSCLRYVTTILESASDSLPRNGLLLAGYGLFIWCTVQLIGVGTPMPDMAVAGFVFTATELLLRIRHEAFSFRKFAVLGLLLGFGYLTKTVLLFVGLVCIAVAVFSVQEHRKRLMASLVSIGSLAIIALPFIVTLSTSYQHVTVGEAGRLNYIWYVAFNRGGGPEGVKPYPVEPNTNTLCTYPHIYEFAKPVSGTYPPWNDPSYWARHYSPRFDLSAQTRVALHNLKLFGGFLIGSYGVLALGLVLLIIISDKRATLSALRRLLPVALPSLFGCGLYILVLLQSRYVGGYLAIIYLWLLASLRVVEGRRKIAGWIAAGLFVAGVGIAAVGLVRDYGNLPAEESLYANECNTVKGLQAYGIHPGDPVASIGLRIYTARLAGVRIVATMIGDDDAVWSGAEQEKAIQVFRRTGAKAIIAEHVKPEATFVEGWKKIEGADAWVFLLLPS